MTDVYVEIEGVKGVLHLFDVLPDDLNKKVIRQAVKKASRAVLNAAKRFAVFDRGYSIGAFKRSLGVKVRYYRATDATIGIVGSRRGAQWKGRSNIAHLLERGWRTARGGTLQHADRKAQIKSRVTGERGKGVAVGKVPGKHIMQRAHLATQSQVASILHSELREGIEREVRLLNAG